MDRKSYHHSSGGIGMTESENRRKRMGAIKPSTHFRLAFLVLFIQCLSHSVLGQNDLTLTFEESDQELVENRDFILLCQMVTSVTGAIQGNSPLTWTSSTGSLPPGSYAVESANPVGTATTYQSRLNFKISASLANVQLTCSAAIGTHTGSKPYTIRSIIIKPNKPVLTGPATVKAGEELTWTCVSSGASIKGPNVYYRDSNGVSITQKIDKNTLVSIDQYGNFLYTTETTLTFSIAPTDPTFLLSCFTVQQIGSFSDQQTATLPITVLFPPQISKDGDDDIRTTENVRTTISCNIEASSPDATSLSWTKNGNQLFIDPNRYEGATVNSPSLIIKSALEADDGEYICSATNDQGTGSFDTSTTLVVRYTAKFDYPSGTSFTGGAGTTFTLPCNARAVPAATTIRWKRVLNGATDTIRISSNPKYSGGDALNNNYGLTIASLQPEDEDGQYYCEVDNNVGSSSSPQLTIVVNDRPTVTTSTASSITVNENTQFGLSCVVQPLNTLTAVRWEKDGVTIDTAGNQVKYFGGNTLNPSLTVRSATDSDGGNYVCVATNAYGSTFGPTISVTLLYKPRVVVSPQPISSNGGGTVFLTCAVNANPAVTLVYWNKNGARIDSSAQPSKYSGGTTDTPPLIVFNAETSDSGDYFCIAQNSQGTTFSNAVTVTVTDIPSVTVTPTTAVIPEGTISYMFTCSVSSSPAATEVYWTFNGVKVNEDTNSNKYIGGNLATPSITIRNVDRSDDGSYMCVALNPRGQGASTVADLSVTYLPTFTFNTNPIGKQVGTSVTINCGITANPAITSFSWVKDGVTLNLSDPAKYQGGTLGNPNLSIFDLQTSDSGRYSCQAVNSRGTANSPQVALSVSSKPSIEDPPASVGVQEGQTAVMPCVVTPLNTLTSVTWTKDGVNVDTSNPAKYSGGTTTTPSLTIFNAADNDVGRYRCTAVNDFGTMTGGQIALLLTYKPRLTVPTTPVTEDVGRSIFVSCAIDANPDTTLVYWRKDGSSTQLGSNTNPSKYRGGTIETPSLTILSSALSDTGNYECVAVNSVGTSFSSVVAVSVVGIPTVTSGSSSSLSVKEGNTNVLLQCSFEANPAPSDVYWTKDGSRLDTVGQPNKYLGGTIAGANLNIRTIEPSDKGRYVCHVVNDKGTGTSSPTQLSVTYKPKLSVTTVPITVSASSAVVLMCTIDANPQATQVYWLKDGDTSKRLNSDLDPSKYGGGTVAIPSLTVRQTTIDDGGDYVCVAINTVGVSTSTDTRLIIESTPAVSVGNQNPTATEGDNDLAMTCSFTANPDPTDFYWTKDGSRLDVSTSNGNKYSGGREDSPTLVIRTVDASDRGQYVCNVLNAKGLGSSPIVRLTVRYKPILTVPSSPISQNSGTNVILSCSLDAFPSANQVYWTKDGSPTQLSSASNPSKYGGGSTLNPSLTIFGSSIDDSGEYKCNAQNNIGLTSSNAITVNIEGQPSVTVGDNTTPTATEGDVNLVLQCGFKSNPTPSDLYWTKDGSRLDPTTPANKYSGGIIDTPSLTIRTVSPSDRGQYVCHVVNGKGTGSSPSIQLDVTYKPIITVSGTPISVPTGTPTTLTCNVNSNPAPTGLYWAVFGQPIDLANNPTKYDGGTVDKPNLSIVISGAIDSGDYTCVVTNAIGSTTSDVVKVSFTSIPTVTATVPSTPIPEGSANVALSCDFRSVPSAEGLYWTKGGSRITSANQPDKYSGGTLANPTLTILTIDYTDGDTYVCNVRNTIGTGTSTGGDLNVTYKPRIVVSNTPITSSPGTTVTLACQIDANPSPNQVYWTRGGVTVDSASSPSKYRGGTLNTPTLSILSSTFTDGGDYACVVRNTVGLTVSQDVSVSITNVPVVSITPESTTVQSGTSSLQLTCSHISNPSATNLYWTKDGRQLIVASQPAKYSGGTLAAPSLVIRNVDKSDRGTYVCNVVNALGTGSSADSVVDVTFKPDLIVPTTPVQGSTGSPVTLTCQVDANPLPTNIYWTKDGVRLNPTATPDKYSGGSLTTPSLTILSPNFDDTGSYACVVTNNIGPTTSAAVSVNIISIPSVTASLTVSTVQEGATNIILTCNYQANPQATDLFWTKDGTRINSASQTSKYSGGTLDSTPNLTIKTVERTDKGTYICRVQNEQGTGSSLGQSFDVTYKPAVAVVNTPIVSEPGNSVILTCSVTANPAATAVYWTKTGGSQVGSNTNPSKYRGGTVTTPPLTILNTDVSDTGSYSCVATNNVGTTTSAEVSVGIVDVPTVTSTSTVSTVPEGTTNIVFTCSFTANPAPTGLFWTKDNQQLDVSSSNQSPAGAAKYLGGTLSTPSLTIRTVDRDDRGSYRCHVVNARGTGISDPRALDVTFQPSIASNEDDAQGEKGQQVTLTCDVTANPALTVLFWTKNGVQFNLASPAGKYSGGTIAEPDLTISNLDESSDPATYQCTASNPIGTTRGGSVQLTVTFDPVVNIGGDVTANEGATNVVVQCDVQMFPAATSVTWYKDNVVLQVATNPSSYSGGTTATPSLTIRTLATTDAGVYKCSANNGLTTKESGTATLTVNYTPKIQSENPLEAKIGTSITLPCVFSANPAATGLEWKKISTGTSVRTSVTGSRFSGGTLSSPSLTINGVTIADTAQYVCIVTNARGASEGTVDFSTRYQPESVTVTAVPTSLDEGNRFVLTCQADGYPETFTYAWYRGTSRLSGTSKTYTKNQADPEDNANFRCDVSNAEGTSSNSSNLDVRYTPKIQSENPLEAKIGTSITLPCVFSANPAATGLEWKKISTGTSVRTSVTGSRFSGGTLSSPSLTINGVTIADTAQYVCIVTNARGASEGTVDFSTRYQPESVTVTAVPTSLDEGNRFVLTCQADGYPETFTYAWYRGTSRLSGTSKTYTKNQADPEDNANFRCDVSNAEGTSSNSSNLDVRFKPISNRQGRTTVTGTTGTSVTLTCDVRSNPSPTTFAWYKGVTRLFTQNSQKLDLLLTSDADFGEYSCTATNTIGTMSPPQAFIVSETANPPAVGASTEDSGLSTTTIILIVIIIIIVLIILILIIIFCCLQGTCAKCCGKKEKSKVAPAVKPLPPMYTSNGGYFGPVVTPAANGKLRLNDDEEYASPRHAGAGPIISVPENRGGRAHHLPPLSLESTTGEMPSEEKRRSRKKKRRRRGEDEAHLTARSEADRGEEELEVTNVYSNRSPRRNIPLYEEI